MTATQEFRQEQRGVALAMTGALLVTIVVLCIVTLRSRTTASASFDTRLQFALRIDVIVVAWLAATIANVARIRFFSERDIGGSDKAKGSNSVMVAGAILQNTFEQVSLAMTTHLIAAASFTWSDTLIASQTCLFSVGRLLFWLGYHRGAAGRAFGFGLTFYPSVVVLLCSAIKVMIDVFS